MDSEQLKTGEVPVPQPRRKQNEGTQGGLQLAKNLLMQQKGEKRKIIHDLDFNRLLNHTHNKLPNLHHHHFHSLKCFSCKYSLFTD